MRIIDFPPNLPRDERDLLLQKTVNELMRALARVDRLKQRPIPSLKRSLPR